MKRKILIVAYCSIAVIVAVAFYGVLSVGDEYHNGIRVGKIIFQLRYISYALPVAVLLIFVSRKQQETDWLTILVLTMFGWILFVGREGGIWRDEKAWYFFAGAVFFVLQNSYLNILSKRAVYPVLIGFCAVLALLGGVEGVLGELQIFDRYAIYHSAFKVTGTFFNPAPFAGYVIASLPYAICVTQFRVTASWQRALPWIGWICVIMMFIILPATQSRAAWVGLLAATAYFGYHQYSLNERVIAHFNLNKRLIMSLVAVIIMLLLISGYFIYKYKEDSADGRMLIWKVSTNILKQHPWMGVGFDTFPAHYAPALADYFDEGNGTAAERMLAGSVQWAFNEPLHMAVELGIPGGVLYLVLIITAILYPIKKRWSTGNRRLVLLCARSSLIAIAFFGFFSYPFYLPPITLLFFFSLAVIAFTLRPIQSKVLSCLVKACACVLLAVTGLNLYGTVDETREAYALWGTGEFFYQLGHYETANQHFQKALPVLNMHGQFLQQYGKSLQLAGEHETAIEILHRGGEFYRDEFWYITLGEAYRQAGDLEQAERYYKTAAQMIPYMLYPKYLLAKLYNVTGRTSEAHAMARDVLTSKIKVTSTAVSEMQQEMNQLLNNENSELNRSN